jgi:hypothetical protein
LRHTKQPFVVEVRRRRGRAAAASETSLFSLAAREEVAAPASEAPSRPSAPAESPAFGSPRPTGRILPSLEQPEPSMARPAEPEAPRRRGRVAGVNNEAAERKRARAAAEPGGRSAANSPTASSPEARQKGRRRSLDAPSMAGASAASATHPKAATARKTPAKRPDAPKRRVGPQAPADAVVRPPPTAQAQPAPPPVADDGAARGRRRSIMARYVLGTELRMGERWKKRLRRGA